MSSATTVEFFYSSTIDTCQLKGVSIPADQETSHGGVCAFVPSTGKIYACPAPDPTCWTWDESCINGGSDEQITCNASGVTWCCHVTETCTTASGQFNICISNFTSPNAGVPIAQANTTELNALGVSNITATVQTVDPTPFSTRTLGTSATSTSSSSSTSTSSTSTSGPMSTITSTPETSGTKAALSSGAIAGIVVGVVAAILLIACAFFFFGRRRRTRSTDALRSSGEAVPLYQNSAYTGFYHNEKNRNRWESGVDEQGVNDRRYEMNGMGVWQTSELDGAHGVTTSTRHELM